GAFMSAALPWILLLLSGFALVAAYIRVIRRRTAEIRALADKLAREAEEHRESEERYRLLIENAPDAILTLNTEGCFTSINPFGEMLTGWSRNEWMGRQFLPLVHSEDLAHARASFADALNGRKTPMAEVRFLNKAGEFVWMEFIMTPQFRNGRVEGVLA